MITLELHYPMIQFLIIPDIPQFQLGNTLSREVFRPTARERKYLMDCNKQLLDDVLVTSTIIKVEVGFISRSRRLRMSASADDPYQDLLGIAKTESNNFLLCIERKEIEAMFLLLH